MMKTPLFLLGVQEFVSSNLTAPTISILRWLRYRWNVQAAKIRFKLPARPDDDLQDMTVGNESFAGKNQRGFVIFDDQSGVVNLRGHGLFLGAAAERQFVIIPVTFPFALQRDGFGDRRLPGR